MKQINFMTSISNTGYGIAGKYILKELIQKGIDVTLFPYGGGTFDTPEEATEASKVLSKVKPFNINAPCLNLWHQFDLASHVGHGQYYGWPIFELNRFTPLELIHLQCPDELIVCSQWAKDVLQQYKEITQPIYVVPLGVDRSLFFPDEPPIPSVRDNPEQYIFLNIGKWEKRKGHDILAKLFSNAFKPSDNVKLVLMPHNPFLNEQEVNEWISIYKECPLAHKISILNPVPTHKHIAQIINQCNCGIFPSRAEGWNMELLETMSCGKPVIATNYSAHTEYCNTENSLLVQPTSLERAYDGKWFSGEGEWMEIEYEQEEALIEHMKYCYNKRPFNLEGIITAKQYSWWLTVEKLCRVINGESSWNLAETTKKT